MSRCIQSLKPTIASSKRRRGVGSTARRVARGLALACLVGSASPSLAVQVGEPAPACSLELLRDGSRFHSEKMAWGPVTLVDFWASWCAPCAHAFPFLDTLEHSLEEHGFQVVAINVDENRPDAIDFLSRHPVNFTVAVDPTGECPAAFDLPGMPSSFLIDHNGVVRFIHRGFRPAVQQQIRAEVEALLAETQKTDSHQP